jgi:hypothetical protein
MGTFFSVLSFRSLTLLSAMGLALGTLPSIAQDASSIASLIRTVTNSSATALDRENAVCGIRDIGTNAVRAVPVLISLFQTETNNEFLLRLTAEAIGRVGPAARPAVPILIRALADRRPNMLWVKRECAIALSRIGPSAKEAVPGLISVLKFDGNGNALRVDATVALGSIHADARATVPVMLQVLRDPKEAPNLRIEAIRALNRFGHLALEALPFLAEICTNQWDTIQFPEEATKSILSILESVTLNFGVLTPKNLKNLEANLDGLQWQLIELEGVVSPKTLTGIRDAISTIVGLIRQRNQDRSGGGKDARDWLRLVFQSTVIPVAASIMALLVLGLALPVRAVLGLHAVLADGGPPPVPLLKFCFETLTGRLAYTRSGLGRWVEYIVPRLVMLPMPEQTREPCIFLEYQGKVTALSDFSPKVLCKQLDRAGLRLLLTGAQIATWPVVQVLYNWAVAGDRSKEEPGPFIPVLISSSLLSDKTGPPLLCTVKARLNQLIPDFSNLPDMFISRLLSQGHILLLCNLAPADTSSCMPSNVQLRHVIDHICSEVGIRNIVVISETAPSDIELCYCHIHAIQDENGKGPAEVATTKCKK